MSRLATGGMIDRGTVLPFTFDGRPLRGYAGDTLASALLANGVRLVGRSFKYHRPRGILTAGSEEPNALVELRAGARREPNTRATTVELFSGLAAVSQNRFPSLRFDLAAVNGMLPPVFAAGFYYKTFMWPAKAWERLYEPAIRRAAGLGHASVEPDPDHYQHAHLFCDVLVIGGGPAGIAATLAAARTGARVVLCEEDPWLGGRLLSERETIGGAPAAAWLADAQQQMLGLPELRILRRTAVTSVYDHGIYLALERVADHQSRPEPGQPRQRVWHITARVAVLAAGALERPMVFPGNDLPGVMLASAVRTYINRFAVCPGRRMVLLTASDDGWRTVSDAARAGIQVAAIVDARGTPSPAQQAIADDAGAPVFFGGRIAAAYGAPELHRVLIGDTNGRRHMIRADLLAMAGGWNPTLHLSCHLGAKPVWNPALAGFVPGVPPPGMGVAGAAAGHLTLAEALADGASCGAAALHGAGFAPSRTTTDPMAFPEDAGSEPTPGAAGLPPRTNTAGLSPHTNTAGLSPHTNTAGLPPHTNTAGLPGHTNTAGPTPPPSAAGFVPGRAGADLSSPDRTPPETVTQALLVDPPPAGKAFVDFQHDVTAADVALAAREGFCSVELLKRYTTLGMATDQGKTANVNALAIMAALTGASVAETGTTVYRPPYVPVAIGALAGHHRGRAFRPVRLTPAHAWAEQAGAVFTEAGLWLRAQYYPHPGDAGWLDAACREALAVRHAVGVCDVSTLGKIEVFGPDAGPLLDRIYTNTMSTLPVGRARYGLMLREDGMVMDDGTAARLAPDHFVLTSTTGNAAGVLQHMEFCSQVLWPDLDADVLDVTDQWAQFAIAGPRSRAVVQAIAAAGQDVSNAGFPHLAAGLFRLANGVAGRLFRVSYSGEMAFELAVPARDARAALAAILAAGAVHGIAPYGTEALAMLRVEKGHVGGGELNGQTTARDLGLDRMLSHRKDYVGRVLAQRPALLAPERPSLVGVRPVDPAARFSSGAHFLEIGAAAEAGNDRGWISSAVFSPTLGHQIGLGFLAGGMTWAGRRVRAYDPVRNSDTEVEVVSPCFVDPQGERLRA